MLRSLRIVRTLPTVSASHYTWDSISSTLRFFSSKKLKSQSNNGFITIPEKQINVDMCRYVPEDLDKKSKEIGSKVTISFNVDQAEWLPKDVKEVFKKENSIHIDSEGTFTMVSTAHRSVVANHAEAMRKLQKKVNQACISSLDDHRIGSVVDPLLKEKRIKEKRKRSELSRRRRSIDILEPMEPPFDVMEMPDV